MERGRLSNVFNRNRWASAKKNKKGDCKKYESYPRNRWKYIVQERIFVTFLFPLLLWITIFFVRILVHLSSSVVTSWFFSSLMFEGIIHHTIGKQQTTRRINPGNPAGLIGIGLIKGDFLQVGKHRIDTGNKPTWDTCGLLYRLVPVPWVASLSLRNRYNNQWGRRDRCVFLRDTRPHRLQPRRDGHWQRKARPRWRRGQQRYKPWSTFGKAREGLKVLDNLYWGLCQERIWQGGWGRIRQEGCVCFVDWK